MVFRDESATRKAVANISGDADVKSDGQNQRRAVVPTRMSGAKVRLDFFLRRADVGNTG